jgi:hypothetical protein
MRLLWWRTPEEEPVDQKFPVTEATRARVKAEHDLADDLCRLEQIRAETSEHVALGARIHRLFVENHLAPGIEELFRGKK